MFAVLTIVSTTIFEPPSSVQRHIILGFRYQHINLIGSSFQNGITIVNSKFTIIPKIEAKLTSNTTTTSINNSDFTTASSTPLNNVIFTIATNILREKRTSETVATIQKEKNISENVGKQQP
jgi:hypothetical protein